MARAPLPRNLADCRLFADERTRFVEPIAGWPDDVRDHAFALAFGDATFDAFRPIHSLEE